jgi:hypothetical protein
MAASDMRSVAEIDASAAGQGQKRSRDPDSELDEAAAKRCCFVMDLRAGLMFFLSTGEG